jgi:hypothetical protein
MNVIFAWGPPSTNMYDFTFLLVLQTQWIELLFEGTFIIKVFTSVLTPVLFVFILLMLKGPGVRGQCVRVYSIQTILLIPFLFRLPRTVYFINIIVLNIP